MEDRDRDAAARLDLLAGAQWWIGYDRAQEALRKFEHLLRYATPIG